ncbi:MAG TPA: RluA family pseudouridine synthase [Kofleriaceae bacterium]
MAWTVEQPGVTVAAFVKERASIAWSLAKRHVANGKVFVDGNVVTEVDHRLGPGQSVELRLAAPKPLNPEREGVLVFDDPHVVVIDKPQGVNSVPYEDRETGTAMDLIRGTWRRQGKPANQIALHIVHRIDRATSGLLAFAKTKRAELGMAAQLRTHEMARQYICVAHGVMPAQTISSHLIADRGDGLRGSTSEANRGKRAVTHVEVERALRNATLCRVQLETGRTHQIRIHFSEAGHPLVREEVYVRDYTGPVIKSPRLLLHAATLGFDHPITGARVELAAPLPPDFTAMVDKLA